MTNLSFMATLGLVLHAGLLTRTLLSAERAHLLPIAAGKRPGNR